MKTATLPAVRVDPALRDQAESVLADGETLSEFVEASVRDHVQRRVAQGEFVQRGLASLAAGQRSGVTVPADQALARLQSRLDVARAQAVKPKRGSAR